MNQRTFVLDAAASGHAHEPPEVTLPLELEELEEGVELGACRALELPLEVLLELPVEVVLEAVEAVELVVFAALDFVAVLVAAGVAAAAWLW